MIIKFDDIKHESSESAPLPERIDTGKTIITKPELIKEYLRLTDRESKKENTAAERLRLHRLKKYGDNAAGQNKMHAKKANLPSKSITLRQLDNNPITQTPQQADQVIDDIYNGLTFIEACEKNDIKPKYFFGYIEDSRNIEKKIKFLDARVCLAEYYLHRRELLERDLLSGRIDSSTYSTLANDYKYLAGKLAPLAYGDKIQLDAQINKQTTLEVLNTDKIKALSDMISGTIDADFEEISEK